MKKALLSALCLLALAVSCDRGPERIPRGEMEEIMQKILMQDQYIKQHLEVRRQADTMLVYEGIFEQYGYDTDDFLTSLEYYLEDPARMEKVMEKVEKRLKDQLKVVLKELEQENWRKSFLRLYSLNPNIHSQPQPRKSAVDTLYLQFNKDSLLYHPYKKKK